MASQEIVKELKRVGNRYYYFNRLQFRSFPIKRKEAEELLERGEAILLDRFITDPQPNEQDKKAEEPIDVLSQVIDFQSKQKEKIDAEMFEANKQEFIRDVLPRLSGEELRTIIAVINDEEKFRTEILRILMRLKLSDLKL